MIDHINRFYIVKYLLSVESCEIPKELRIPRLNSIFSLHKHFAFREGSEIRKRLSRLWLNSINIRLYHIFTIQCTNVKYKYSHLCLTIPSRYRKYLKSLDLKIINSHYHYHQIRFLVLKLKMMKFLTFFCCHLRERDLLLIGSG